MAIAEIRPDWTIGTLNLTSGSTEFTTTDSLLQTAAIQAGDELITRSGLVLVIAGITGQNSGTLMEPCPAGAAGVGQPLRVRFQPDGSRYNGAAASLIQMLGNGVLAGIAETPVEQDYLLIGGVSGQYETISRFELGGGGGGGSSWNATTPDVAGLSDFDSEEIGFKVLVINAGGGRSAVYEKTVTGWLGPIYFTGSAGANGPANTLTVGDVVSGPDASVTIRGTSPNQVLDFILPRGADGAPGPTGDVTPEVIAARDAAIAAQGGAESARDAAASSQLAAAGSATSATNSAADAEAARVAAVAARTGAEIARSGAETAEENAGASAGLAAGSADDASTSASEALGSATAAANSAASASASATSAANNAASIEGDAALVAADRVAVASLAGQAANSADLASEFANAPEGIEVEPGLYSAYHWSKVAETAAGGGVQSVNGKTGANIILDPSDIGAATAAQGGRADTALQTLVQGSNITITGTGTSRTISATSAPQVQSDWNATTGLGVILNKPTLGTASASAVSDFATAAQGGRADTALQTLTSGANITITGTGTSRTIAAIVPAQVQSDWNATTGSAAILNKPTLGTAAAQPSTAFATSAQGGRADTALQTLTQGANITITGTGTSRTIAATVPVTSVAGRTGAVVLTSTDVGLGNVNNTSDASKPVSTAQAAAIDLKVNKAGDAGIGGYSSVLASLGSSNGRTIKPDLTVSNYQVLRNTGPFTLQAPDDTNCSIVILVWHAGTEGGAITATGFSKAQGSLNLASGKQNKLIIECIENNRTLTIVEAN